MPKNVIYLMVLVFQILGGCSPTETDKNQLIALVEEGYSCDNMQCGYITYSKTIEDTTWYVGVEVNCDTIIKERRDIEFEEFDILLDSNDRVDVEPMRFGEKMFADLIQKNPYFPFDMQKIEKCEVSLSPSGFRVASATLTFDIVEKWAHSNGYVVKVSNPKDSVDFGWQFKLLSDDSSLISSGTFWRTLDYPLDSNLWVVDFTNSKIFNDTH